MLQNYCKILILQEQPYPLPKYRTKINEYILSYELNILSQAATDNINHEITLLQERQISRTKEIENMDTEIKN